MLESHRCEQTLHAFTRWYPLLWASEMAACEDLHNPI